MAKFKVIEINTVVKEWVTDADNKTSAVENVLDGKAGLVTEDLVDNEWETENLTLKGDKRNG